jgi:hypothetical protein
MTRTTIKMLIVTIAAICLDLCMPAQSVPSTAKAGPMGNATEYRPNRFSKRAALHYGLVWGVDSLSVKWAESGELIRFSYRVVDSDRAAILNDKAVEPALIDPQAGVSLVIPSLEKVGKLRQSSTPIDGRSYWMSFSNKGRLVKRGDRVTVVIGQFRAEALRVE